MNDAIYLNPSYNSLLHTYSISANYGKYGGGEKDSNGDDFFHGHNLNFSLQDGRSEIFQAGVGYTDRDDTRVVSVGASHDIVERVGVGIGGKFFFPKGTGERSQDMNVSSTWIVNEWLQTALMADNLVQTEGGKSAGAYREIILGTKWNIEGILLVYFDPHVFTSAPTGLSSYGHETGIEITLLQDVFIRGGFFNNATIPWEAAVGRGWGWGLGWLAPRISLDYGMSKANFPISATLHNFGMTIYF